jgi:hypothetical protein
LEAFGEQVGRGGVGFQAVDVESEAGEDAFDEAFEVKEVGAFLRAAPVLRRDGTRDEEG